MQLLVFAIITHAGGIMIVDEREKIREELRAACLQVGIHPDTFDNEPLIDEAIKQRKKYAERFNSV